MARFVLRAGKLHRGRQKDYNRVTINPGEAFETVSEKETEFCRKYPENFQEVAGPLPQFAGTMVNSNGVRIDTVTNDPVNPAVVNGDTVEVDMKKLESMNMRDLLLFCRTNGITTRGLNKSEVLKDIDTYINNQSSETGAHA